MAYGTQTDPRSRSPSAPSPRVQDRDRTCDGYRIDLRDPSATSGDQISLPMADGMDFSARSAALKAAEECSPTWWRLMSTWPGSTNDQGYFATVEDGKRLIELARRTGRGPRLDALLQSAGFAHEHTLDSGARFYRRSSCALLHDRDPGDLRPPDVRAPPAGATPEPEAPLDWRWKAYRPDHPVLLAALPREPGDARPPRLQLADQYEADAGRPRSARRAGAAPPDQPQSKRGGPQAGTAPLFVPNLTKPVKPLSATLLEVGDPLHDLGLIVGYRDKPQRQTMALTAAQPISPVSTRCAPRREIRRRANLRARMTPWSRRGRIGARPSRRLAGPQPAEPLINTQGSTWAGREHPRFAR